MSNMMTAKEMERHFKSSVEIEKEYEDKIKALEAKNGELEKKLEIAVEALKKIAREYYGRPSTMMSEARQALAAIKDA